MSQRRGNSRDRPEGPRDRRDGVAVGRLARGTIVAGTALKIGAKKLGFATRHAFSSDERRRLARSEHDREVGETLFSGLGKLKGVALKAGQALSLEMGLLPEGTRNELFRAHYEVPPLNRAVVRRVIQNELGAPPERVFASFEPDAFAAASLGQVHRATLAGGERVAVKIQYPGVDETIPHDLHLGRRLVAGKFNQAYLDRMFAEIGARVAEEVDYEQEAEATTFFQRRLKVPGVTVPEVFPRYSTRRVLTTRLLDGLTFREAIVRPMSAAERSRYAQRMWDAFLRSFFELHRLHADPNPGNYLFGEDGSIGLIDFGCTKKLEPSFVGDFRDLWTFHVRRDLSAGLEIYEKWGWSRGESGSDMQRLIHECVEPFGEWVAAPVNGLCDPREGGSTSS